MTERVVGLGRTEKEMKKKKNDLENCHQWQVSGPKNH